MQFGLLPIWLYMLTEIISAIGINQGLKIAYWDYQFNWNNPLGCACSLCLGLTMLLVFKMVIGIEIKLRFTLE